MFAVLPVDNISKEAASKKVEEWIDSVHENFIISWLTMEAALKGGADLNQVDADGFSPAMYYGDLNNSGAQENNY